MTDANEPEDKTKIANKSVAASEIESPSDVDTEEQSWGDTLIRILPDEPLKPRYRKLVEMSAQGLRTNEIAKELGYTPGRVSVILSNTIIKHEVQKLRDRIYEETIEKRLKAMSEPALALIEKCLTDQTHRYKEQLKIDTAKWLVEKLDGKAVQKHELGGSILIGMMDRLDAMRSAGRSLYDGQIEVEGQKMISERSEVTDIEVKSEAQTEEDRLAQWVRDL